MDKRRALTGLMLAMAVFLLWPNIVAFFARQMGVTPPQAQQTTETQPGASGESPPAAPTTGVALGPTSSGSIGPTSAPAYAVRNVEAIAPVISLGSATPSDPNFAMQLNISPRGAGVESVVLNDFKKTATSPNRYVYQEPYRNFEDRSRPLATRTLWINGTQIDLASAAWHTVESDGSSATFAVEIGGTDAPVARITKKFTVPNRTDDANGPRGFEISVTQQIENLTNQPLSVRFDLNGPTTPPVELDRGQDRQVIGGYALEKRVTVEHQYLESFTKDKPSHDMTKPEKTDNPLLWAGTCSVYFNALVRPEPLGSEPGVSPKYIKSVHADMLYEGEGRSAHDRQVAVTFSSDELTIAPSQTLTIPLHVFFGPRQRALLNNAHYVSFPLAYNETLVLVSGACSYCTFTWLINALVGLLGFFHFIFRDWGLAIIALVCLVRTLLHPITKRSQVSMMKMGKLGPEIEKLKKKHADNQEELNKAMMQFYKQNGASPVLGCLPMFLQMPIWIALWQSLQTTFELRQAPFLHPFGIPLTWIHDLSQPDHLITFAKTFTLFGLIPISGLNILPVLLGFVFWLQAKYQPKPAAATPEQLQQQKMMQWMMPFMFPLFLYGGPSGLNLYILTSTAIGIMESKIVRKHIKEQEEREKDGRVIVDAKPTRNSKQNRNELSETPKPQGFAGKMMAKVAEFQKKVEEMREQKPRS